MQYEQNHPCLSSSLLINLDDIENKNANTGHANAIVYCKASSNSNPATGNQGRMAFMAYVGYSGSTITNVEFQYYRSVSTHSDSQQGDQVFIYKLESTNGGKWTVTTREASSKIVAGTGLSSSYSNGTLTLTNSQTVPDAATTTPLMDGTASVGTSTSYAREDHVHPTDTSIFELIYPVGSIYMSVNSTSPASLFGGTWEQIKDTFLLSAGDTYTAGATGGSATKNLQHAHTTGGHTLTETELPKITGAFSIRRWGTGGGSVANDASGHFSINENGSAGSVVPSSSGSVAQTRVTYAFGGNGSHSHGNTGNGLGTTQDIMPPYLAVYVWKRVS